MKQTNTSAQKSINIKTRLHAPVNCCRPSLVDDVAPPRPSRIRTLFTTTTNNNNNQTLGHANHMSTRPLNSANFVCSFPIPSREFEC
jgi:hypothetical protein